jgi:CheY-like chemotaxis protein
MINCILLVDDDKINNFINSLTIKKMGIAEEIISFTKGQEALHFLKEADSKEKKYPGLILVDMNMPLMDGFEFMKEFRALNSKNKDSVHIIILTTSTNPLDIKRMADLGITQFLDKPLSKEALTEALKNIPGLQGAN